MRSRSWRWWRTTVIALIRINLIAAILIRRRRRRRGVILGLRLSGSLLGWWRTLVVISVILITSRNIGKVLIVLWLIWWCLIVTIRV